MKVLITGGTRGLGLELMKSFSPDGFSISRGTGYDISQKNSRDQIIALSLEYDIFINNAFCGDFSQVYLLYECFQVWREKEKKGHIFNISSYSTVRLKDERKTKELLTYIPYKYALDIASSQCSAEIETNHLPFRITNLRPSTLDTEKMRSRVNWPGVGHKGGDIAELISWVYHQPPYVSFIDVSMSVVRPQK